MRHIRRLTHLLNFDYMKDWGIFCLQDYLMKIIIIINLLKRWMGWIDNFDRTDVWGSMKSASTLRSRQDRLMER